MAACVAGAGAVRSRPARRRVARARFDRLRRACGEAASCALSAGPSRPSRSSLIAEAHVSGTPWAPRTAATWHAT